MFLVMLSAAAISSRADGGFRDHIGGAAVAVEASATVATGDFAPLWLTANRYGLSSVRTASAYQRVSALRDMACDSLRPWRLGYGLDVALAEGHERTGIVQQAYVEAAWKVLHLTVGAKQQPLETHGSELTSGDLSTGINARPVPQVRLDVDWFGFPGTRRWWMWKLYGSYGMMTDGCWQQSWTADGMRYARRTLYHEKGLFWRFGREDVFPLSYEIGLRMVTQFGGTSYNVSTSRVEGGEAQSYKHSVSAKAFWDALLCRGSDATDGTDPNTAGNTLGSYVMQLRYRGRGWEVKAYWERFFEDQSMLTVQYGIRDMLIGGEVTMPRNRGVSTAVVEWLSTTNQSGAVYHDRTDNIPDKMNGRDNYYNHLLYSGWQHYGMTPGNPLLTQPLYNGAFGRDGVLRFFNNRVRALHLGLAGDPSPEWHWRVMATFSRNWGSYDLPLADPHVRQDYYLGEATYRPRRLPRFSATAALGLDHGRILGNSFGGQLTLRYEILKNP